MSTLVLVPSSLRAARASRRLCDAEGGVLFGPRVMTPAQLAPGLLAASGDARTLLTPLAEHLLAFDAAVDGGAAPAGTRVEGGAARVLASTVAELRAAEVPVAALEQAARRCSGAAAERLACASRTLRRYEERLGDLRALDRAGALAAAAAAVQQRSGGPELRDLRLLVLEGFTTLSAVEWRLVAALASVARRTHARLPFFPERSDLDAPEPLLRRLEALHDLSRGDVGVHLEHVCEGRAAGLEAALLSVAGGPGSAARELAECVDAAAGAGEDGEGWMVAQRIAGWLDAGIPPDEVLVFAPSPAKVARPLSLALAEHGIPFAAGVGESLVDVPPARAVLRALDAAATGLDRAAVEELLGSTYLAAAVPPARVRELLDRAGALDGRGEPDDLLRRRAQGMRSAARERDLLLAAAESVSDLKRLVRGLRARTPARDHAARLRAFLEGGVRRRAARSEPALARRDLAALKRLDDCGDAVVTALATTGRGDVALSTPEWASLLRLAVADAVVPPADPSAGAVELWALSDAAGASCRAAAVVGCARGALPPASSRPGLLRDPERAAVNSALERAALPPSGRDRGLALHGAFCALAAPREALFLTWPSGADGSAPAPLVAEVLAAVGQRLDVRPRGAPALANAPSPRAALAAAARLAAGGAAAEAGAALAAASSSLAERFDAAVARARIEGERQAALASRTPAPHAGGVSPGGALEAALPVEWSPSQLETDARCPFRFFLETACRLSTPDEPVLDVASRDEGKLLHRILERFLAARIGRGARPLEDGEDARRELRDVAEALFGEVEPSGALGDPALWPARRDVIFARLERVLAAEAAAAEADGLQPRLVEHAFGGELAPLVFSDGPREVRLCGRIDRVDASADRLRVVDWKNGRASSTSWREKVDPDAFGVTSFQLPTYLIAAARALPGRSRIEAGYAFLRSASRSSPFATDAHDPMLSTDGDERARARDAGTSPFADAVIGTVDRIRQGRFPIAPRDCSGCGFGAVCRAEGTDEDDP